MKANSQGFWPPSYDGHGLLNLVSSIATACGAEAWPSAPLAEVDTSSWAKARNIVLLLADGVGADFIARTSPDGPLHRHQVATITSVCPTTTASAIPTLMTGLPPAGHGLTGWNVYLDEIDAITAVLPLSVRGGYPGPDLPIEPNVLYDYPNLYPQLFRQCHIVSPARISGSPFSRTHSFGATLHAYQPQANPWLDALPFCRRRRDFFGTLRRLCHEKGRPQFIYGYWPDFDHAAHEHGVDSPTAVKLFKQFEIDLENFLHEIRGTDTLVLVTADHGFVDSPPDRQIHLADHTGLAALLTRPLSGERRLAYCSLKPGAARDFEDYISTVFPDRMAAWPRAKLLDEGWFGPGTPHPKLAARIGDYALVMKDVWTLVDQIPGERPIRMLGVHGGLSRYEMRIPLSVVPC